MMNTVSSRLLGSGLIVLATLLPHVALAQDMSTLMDNSSGWIGMLVVWLLPIGGIFAVAVAMAMDKGAQASRSGLAIKTRQ